MALDCDLVIRNAEIVDGTGTDRFTGDLAVSGERIVALGDLPETHAAREVDAAGLVLAPGFIDAHTHDDRAVLGDGALVLPKMSQGVTSVVVGSCGISVSPLRASGRAIPPLNLLGGNYEFAFPTFRAYADRLARERPPVNVTALVGHMSLRVEAMGGEVDRPATAEETAQMRRRLAEALDEGASGLSTGLWYAPNIKATTSEVIAVAAPLGAHDGLYVTHMRDEADDVLKSIDETARIGREAGAAVIISHHKCAMPENHGRSRETLPAIEAAAARQRLAFDVYPYAASSTVLQPNRLHPQVPVQITWSTPHPEARGRMLDDIAAEWGIDRVAAAEKLLPAGGVFFMMDEGDVRRILAHPLSMIGSDGLPHDPLPHPRLWGSFARVLGHYARDEQLFSLETAIHKMTGRTAAVFGLKDRGELRPGAYADLVLFDAAKIREVGTFADPCHPAEGIVETWVNGASAYTPAGGIVSSHHGRLLTRGR